MVAVVGKVEGRCDMKCTECEYFKVLFQPMGKYDSGQAKCEKHDLVVDFFSRQKLGKLTCIEESERGVK